MNKELGVNSYLFPMPVLMIAMRGMPLLSYTYLARRWGWSKSRVGRFMLKAGEYGIISRVSFSSSRGSVISMCRYREMIFGDTCEELELSMDCRCSISDD